MTPNDLLSGSLDEHVEALVETFRFEVPELDVKNARHSYEEAHVPRFQTPLSTRDTGDSSLRAPSTN